MTFSCFVRGIPAPQGSKRAFRAGSKTVVVDNNPKALKDWRAAVNGVLQHEWEGPPLDEAVSMTIVFQLPRPKSLPKKYIQNTKRPDIDKLIRAVLDACTGVAFKDDSQVMGIAAFKYYRAETGAYIEIKGVGI